MSLFTRLWQGLCRARPVCRPSCLMFLSLSLIAVSSSICPAPTAAGPPSSPEGSARTPLPKKPVFAWVRWTDIAVTHPAMDLWDQSFEAFLDGRNSRIDSTENLALSQALQRELQTLEDEEEGLVPAMNELRRQWQSDHPDASDDALRKAFEGFEETYHARVSEFALRRGEIEKQISALGWSPDDLVFNREKHFRETVARIDSDIRKACVEVARRNGFSAVFDGSLSPIPPGPDVTAPPFDMIAGNPFGDIIAPGWSGNAEEFNEMLKIWISSSGKSLEPLRRSGGPWLIPFGGRDMTLEAMRIIRDEYNKKSPGKTGIKGKDAQR